MKSHWLAILACLLVVACDNSAPDPSGGDGGGGAAVKKETPAEKDNPVEKEAEASDDSEGDGGEKAGGEKAGGDDNSFDPNAKVDDGKANPVASAEEKLEQLEDAFAEAMASYRKDMQAAKPAERRKIFEAFNETAGELAVDAIELAQEDPASDFGREALLMAYNNSRSNPEINKQASELLLEHHIDADEFASIAMSMGRSRPDGDVVDQLKTIVDKSKSPAVKAAGIYSLAMLYKSAAEGKKFFEENPGREAPEFIANFDPSSVNIEEMLTKIADEYADVDTPNRGTFGELVEKDLFEIKFLSIGKEAPDIEGKDLDGVEFKLSDYRGKVVVLDFWGDW